MFLSTLLRRLETLPRKESVLREAVRQLQDWLGVESAFLQTASHKTSDPRVEYLESTEGWTCSVRVAEFRLEFKHPTAPSLSDPDREGLDRFASLLQELLESPEISRDLFHLEEQVQDLIDTSLHLLASLTPEGEIITVNQRQQSSPIGRPVWEAQWLSDESRGPIKEAVEKVRAEGVPAALQIETTRSSVYEMLLTPLMDEDGEVKSLIARGRDTSHRRRMRNVLLDEREFLRAVLESIDEAIIVCDLEGEVTLVNAAAVRRFGLHKGEQAEDKLTFLATEEGGEIPSEATPLGRILAGEELREVRTICYDVDRDVRLMNASGCRLFDSEGLAYGAVVALSDTTMQRRAEQALLQSERQLRALFNSQPSALISLDSDGRIVRCNPAVESLLGRRPDEMLGLSLSNFIDLPSDSKYYFTGEREFQVLRPDKKPCWGLATTVWVRDGEGDLGVMWIIRDISKQKQTQRELDISNRKLAESREMERNRLARELHDGAVQNLLAVSYRMKEQDLRDEVVHVVRQLRSLISDLRPPGLREFGLEAALEGLLAKIKRQHQGACPELNMSCRVHDELPEAVGICLFRVVQESVINVVRHAEASEVKIKLEENDSQISLTVTDDGKGFEVPQDVTSLAERDSFGLAGLKERVNLVKGDLRISSFEGLGTTVEVQISLDDLPNITDSPEPR